MKKMMALLATAITVATAAFSGSALAHGETPKHGGVVSSVNELHFELVSKDGKATLYIEDHGSPVPSTGISGKLTVLNGAEKTEVPLEAAGSNMLASKGEAKLAKGSKAIASLNFADKKTVNVRFSIK